jgi:putative methyltransferase (TIGR04325 family)
MLDLIKRLGPVRALRAERYRTLFESEAGYGMHHGMFRTFSEARSAAPKSNGFNEEHFSTEYDDRVDRVFPYDYPVLFWLERILEAGMVERVLDIGGHVGVHYYAYRRYLSFPPELKWRVSEVERIVQAGRARAQREGASALEFTENFEDLDSQPADVLISAGALHYVEEPLLWDVIERARARPAHLLLNKLPLYDGEDFVSLQNAVRRPLGFSPHYVWNCSKFVERFERLGYRTVDAWSVPDRKFYLHDLPDYSFGAYSGLYLRRD